MEFDETFDVVVIGYGFAGALAEKAENPGRISICSGGAMRGAHDADAAFTYLRATCGGQTPDDVLRGLADGMAGIKDEVPGWPGSATRPVLTPWDS